MGTEAAETIGIGEPELWVGAMVEGMREADRREALALGLADLESNLRDSIRMSCGEAFALSLGSDLLAMFGLCPAGPLHRSYSTPWLLCTDQAAAHAKSLIPVARKIIANWRTGVRELRNIVHTENQSAIDFIEALGFELGGVVRVNGEAFREFSMRGTG